MKALLHRSRKGRVERKIFFYFDTILPLHFLISCHKIHFKFQLNILTYHQLIYRFIFCLRSIQSIYMSFLGQRHAITGLSDLRNILLFYVYFESPTEHKYLPVLWCDGITV